MTVSLERLISCWIMRIMLWKPSSCSTFLNSRVDRSYWKPPFTPTRWGDLSWIIMDINLHPDFHELGWWQHCRPCVTLRIIHRCNLLRPPKPSVQGNCMSFHYTNRMGGKNMLKSILETRSDFLWTCNQEGDLLGVYSPQLYTYQCVCRNYWGPEKCHLWVLS